MCRESVGTEAARSTSHSTAAADRNTDRAALRRGRGLQRVGRREPAHRVVSAGAPRSGFAWGSWRWVYNPRGCWDGGVTPAPLRDARRQADRHRARDDRAARAAAPPCARGPLTGWTRTVFSACRRTRASARASTRSGASRCAGIRTATRIRRARTLQAVARRLRSHSRAAAAADDDRSGDEGDEGDEGDGDAAPPPTTRPRVRLAGLRADRPVNRRTPGATKARTGRAGSPSRADAVGRGSFLGGERTVEVEGTAVCECCDGSVWNN